MVTMPAKTSTSSTRGYGLLERHLAQRRFRTAEGLLHPLEPRHRLLDIGCGAHPAFLLRQACEIRCGVDREIPHEPQPPSSGRVSLGRWDLETETRLPFENGSFDVVTMLAVVEHLEESRSALLFADIGRVLRPGGRLVLTTPARWGHTLLRGMARCHLVSRVEIAEHKTSYTRERLRSLLTKAGFDPLALRSGCFECGANLWALATRGA